MSELGRCGRKAPYTIKKLEDWFFLLLRMKAIGNERESEPKKLNGPKLALASHLALYGSEDGSDLGDLGPIH